MPPPRPRRASVTAAIGSPPVGNAGKTTYSRSIVMYRRGYEGEGRRLAHDLGIRTVGPLDGMRPAQLHGAQAVVVLGS